MKMCVCVLVRLITILLYKHFDAHICVFVSLWLLVAL